MRTALLADGAALVDGGSASLLGWAGGTVERGAGSLPADAGAVASAWPAGLARGSLLARLLAFAADAGCVAGAGGALAAGCSGAVPVAVPLAAAGSGRGAPRPLALLAMADRSRRGLRRLFASSSDVGAWLAVSAAVGARPDSPSRPRPWRCRLALSSPRRSSPRRSSPRRLPALNAALNA